MNHPDNCLVLGIIEQVVASQDVDSMQTVTVKLFSRNDALGFPAKPTARTRPTTESHNDIVNQNAHNQKNSETQ
jgi:hypothetical protein